MSFNSIEISEYGGNLLELYAFKVGSTTYRFVNTAKEVVIAGTSVDQTIAGQTLSADGTYQPALIEMDELEDTPSPDQLSATFRLTRDNPVVLAFRGAPPGFSLPVAVWRKHVDDAEVIRWFKGDVLSCAARESEGRVTADPPLAKTKRLGNHKRYQYQCNLTTYSDRCGVDVADFTHNVTVTVIDGNVITVSGMPGGLPAEFEANYFVGGWMVAPDGSIRFITAQDGNDLTLMLSFDADSMIVTDTVQIVAGDDRFHTTCRDKFWPAGGAYDPGEGNVINHFGYFTRPTRNPWKQGGIASAGASGFATFPNL